MLSFVVLFFLGLWILVTILFIMLGLKAKWHFILSLLYVAVIIVQLHDKGYCYKTGKFFYETPVQERVDEIIRQRILPDTRSTIADRFYQGNKQIITFDPIIHYDSVEQFKKINPDCCIFYKDGVDLTFLPEVMTGEIYGVIEVNYLVFKHYSGFMPNYGLEYSPVERMEDVYFISRCGEVKSFFDYL